jgi:ADP-heptose:LPS heptosyltransferase
MRVCVYHAGALGDFVTIMPLLHVWRSTHPEDTLVLLSRLDHGKLAAAWGMVDAYHDVESASFSSLFSATPPAQLMARLGNPQVGLLFVAPGNVLPQALRTLGVGIIYSQPPFPPDPQHCVAYHFQMPGLHLIPPNPQQYQMRLVDGARFAALRGRAVAIIHPGSGAALKNWPAQRFVAVAAALTAWGCEVCWLRGPAEGTILTGGYGTVVEPAGSVALAQLLSGAVLYVGNDSGVSHCAAAVGCGCVVLFGPSDATVWRPFGRSVVVVEAHPECHPCHGSTRAGQCGSSCMERIGVEQVVGACREVLEAAR